MTTLNLADLIGVSLDGVGCALESAQLEALGLLLLESCPPDENAICFVGGMLSPLAARVTLAPRLVDLANTLGDDPFLVLAGGRGAFALLTAPALTGYSACFYSDAEHVDRAALVLSQFGDASYNLDTLSNPNDQRALLATIVAGLLDAASLKYIDLTALLPNDQSWLRLGQVLARQNDAHTLLTLQPLQQMIRACGGSRALFGQLDASQQQLTVLSATDPAAPEHLRLRPEALGGVMRSRQPGSLPATEDALAEQSDRWAEGDVLTVVPLLGPDALWGLLLIASARPLAANARAALNGLGVLLQHHARRVSRPAAPAPAPPPAPPPEPVAPPATAMVRQGTRSGLARSPGRASASDSPSLLPLLDHVQDGVILVDGRGVLVACNVAASALLDLNDSAPGQPLTSGAASLLVPILTDALLGDLRDEQPLPLPDGTTVTVRVLSLENQHWAFVLHPQHPPAAPAADDTLPPLAIPSLDEYNAGAGGQQSASRDYSEGLLSNFSNMIRGPLQALRELVTRVPAAGSLNEQQSHLIGQVVKLNSELTLLVNDLLTLGQVQLVTSDADEPLRPDLLVEAAIGTRYAEFGRRGQEVVTEIDPHIGRVLASEDGLGRAIGALLDNAILYSPPGATITVRVMNEGDDVIIEVQDTGPGLEPDEAAQIFEPFYRAPNAEQLGVPGRGLGLTIAKAVIEHQHGRIWVDSTAGQGATFAFSLPMTY